MRPRGRQHWPLTAGLNVVAGWQHKDWDSWRKALAAATQTGYNDRVRQRAPGSWRVSAAWRGSTSPLRGAPPSCTGAITVPAPAPEGTRPVHLPTHTHGYAVRVIRVERLWEPLIQTTVAY